MPEQEPEQISEEKPMTEFELCRELQLKGFPQRHHDEAWYYLRPDTKIRADNFDSLKSAFEGHYPNFAEFIYEPVIQDFLEFLGTDLQQVVQTNRSGWFAYVNSTLGEGVTTRSGGTTMWLALANVCYARLLEKDMHFPLTDVSTSENVQEGKEPSDRKPYEN